MLRPLFAFCVLLLAGLLSGCQAPAGAQAANATTPAAAAARATALPTTAQAATATLPPPQPVTATPSPSSTPSATPTATGTATITPSPTVTATPIGPCTERVPADDLFTLVTRTYPLSRNYAPGDLVAILPYFPMGVTLGYPTEVRQVILQPLIAIVEAMQSDGLAPFIISGYRSYSAQAIARQKWEGKYPAWVDQISAIPGTSEHQLGTTVDFGSPELPDIVGEPDIQFHTYFYMTREGVWLEEHAHEYGFTLSYPRDTLELTGFYYEPWHYRYVGVEMATMLKAQGITLTQYLLETQPIPCIPTPEP